ncbi:hypothetical protein [Gracilinema caldarium]|uniref:PBS lyase HEAT domain protein repeat-containing protein n=1 Tax=Gracilinema caldarium (strain ATCC 51460 / DSM 7334 / H1) TaxID=744872 RepID=F8EY10_GRAC1|nr:hypothetical protein [Gracilinema caldarium]AEJ20671.1 PBS lyase HEAT domain protein repeat-containing protein [Gracilinema caldarium DSM 7334]
MKRFLTLVLIALCGVFVFATESIDVYTFLYEQATSMQERLAILKSLSDQGIDGAGPLYTQALSQLLQEYPSLKTTADREAADQCARLLAQLLGSSKYTAAAVDLWRVVENFANPLVKADALIAMGKLRHPDYAEHIEKLLYSLNLKPVTDPEAGEKIAYGAILALEKYQQPSGYLPVFFAATGWYNKRIREQAEQSLPYILENPENPLSELIKSSAYTYDLKLLALQRMEASKAASNAKARVAVVALTEGWRSATMDVKQRVILGNIRKLSIDMLRRYQITDAIVLPLLERSYKEGIDTEEKLGSIAALAAMGTDDAARLLSNFLLALNAKRKANNITQEDEQLVRAIIPALGSMGKAVARPALQAVEYQDWTNYVKTLAQDALKQIK